MTSPPADSAASATAPISPTRPPPYTRPMPRLARPSPTARAAASVAGVDTRARAAEHADPADLGHEPLRTRARRAAAPSAVPRGPDARSGSSPRPTTGRTSGHRAVPTPARRSGRSRSHPCRAVRRRSARGRSPGLIYAESGSAPGIASASTHTYRAPRRSGGNPASASSSFWLLSLSVACSPAYRRVRTPGAPSSASTSIPESSASVGRPDARNPKRALIAAFVAERGAVLDRVALEPQLVERHQLGALEPEQLAQLAELVLATGGDEEPGTSRSHRRTVASTSACAANSVARPSSARSSIDVIDARSNGLPSAVPCSSTYVPASVPTTFMSTSARESSL